MMAGPFVKIIEKRRRVDQIWNSFQRKKKTATTFTKFFANLFGWNVKSLTSTGFRKDIKMIKAAEAANQRKKKLSPREKKLLKISSKSSDYS